MKEKTMIIIIHGIFTNNYINNRLILITIIIVLSSEAPYILNL